MRGGGGCGVGTFDDYVWGRGTIPAPYLLPVSAPTLGSHNNLDSRGLCHHGAECNYLHRLPDEGMEARHARDHAVDIFGRDRNPASRDGRKRGTGSYERECRTLYVNYGGAGVEPSAMHAAVRAGFGAWGPVEDVHVAAAKTLAFVRFRWRSSAEFAKAAMHQQSLAGVGLVRTGWGL